MKKGKDLSLFAEEEIILMNRLGKLSPRKIAEEPYLSILLNQSSEKQIRQTVMEPRWCFEDDR